MRYTKTSALRYTIPMTQTEQQRAAAKFAQEWQGKGYEKGDTNKFWCDLLCNVFGIKNFASYIEFEKKVKVSGTNFVDAFIPSTKVLIEQKGIDIDLDRAERQSDGAELTPYEQAKRYFDNQGLDKKPRWIIVCNFREFRVYDMNENHPEDSFQKILLADLENEYSRLLFLVDEHHSRIQKEEQLSKEAGELVGKLYDALRKQYAEPDSKHDSDSLNALCVRLVFCLYAEDARLFGPRGTEFYDYMKSFKVENFRDALVQLFRVLDMDEDERKTSGDYKYAKESLRAFPYVNGGLFADESTDIPHFTEETAQILLEECSAKFNWSEISPTIFGAVFESTLNPQTRRTGGMHYTSIENIHRVIDLLFLDSLTKKFAAIKKISGTTTRNAKLEKLQEEIASLTFLDPACGSGNFLTESYISLRRLENEIIKERYGANPMFSFESQLIKVRLSQFYGIEVNSFAVNVAKSALWIAESQMVIETERIIERDLPFLPLKDFGNIVNGNALRLDWRTLKASANVGTLFDFESNLYPPHHLRTALRGNTTTSWETRRSWGRGSWSKGRKTTSWKYSASIGKTSATWTTFVDGTKRRSKSRKARTQNAPLFPRTQSRRASSLATYGSRSLRTDCESTSPGAPSAGTASPPPRRTCTA